MAYIAATIAMIIGVTAIVGFAAFSYSDAGLGYSYTVGQFIRSQAPLLSITAVVTAIFIFGSSLYKTSVLSAGGGRVASEMGGTLIPTDVQDPLRRRLRNIVEEMAIASGVPVPEIYVLEEEPGINAFAAGFSTSDAAIAVTRGTLELLDRNELQGVIAHEFSHILNGDMKLNVRLMGVLFGIMALGLIGRMIIRGGYHASLMSGRRDRGHPVIFIVGIGLTILGGIGVFFARAIKASVSRQREFLADASAVQFTRQSEGIANALKKIGGYSEGSKINVADPEQVSHMLFGSGAKLAGMFATHPPLIERIQALDPHFKEQDYPHVDPRRHRVQHEEQAQHAAFSGDITTAFASGGTKVLSESIAESVGNPEMEHVEFAQSLRRSIPADLYDAAHSSQLAFLLSIALVLDRSERIVERQLSLLNEQLGAERTQMIRRFYDQLAATKGEYRLPLLEILFPALKLRPAPELNYLVELTTKLIEVDGEIELYEFCFYRIMISSLNQALNPTGKDQPRRRRSELRSSAVDLLRIIADYGHDADSERIAAFANGAKTLGAWAHGEQFQSVRENTVTKLNRCLDILLGLNSKGQEALLRAVSATAAYDGQLSIAEAELIRAVCATLNYPLPPILVHR